MKNLDFEEKKQRGSPKFPIEYYYINEKDFRYVMQLHWHREFEIVRVISGTLRVYLNNSEVVATPGDVVFINSLTLHRADPEDCIYECIVFDMSMICGHGCERVAELLIPISVGDVQTTQLIRNSENPIIPCTEKLFLLLREKKQFHELAVCSALNEIFFHLLQSENTVTSHSTERVGHKKRAIALAVDWIERNYSEKITLRRLAELSDLNEKYFCRIFREFTGQSPTEYINRLRVERACFEMSVNRKNVTEAALDCGFNDLSYFSRIFRRYKGILPREFINERR